MQQMWDINNNGVKGAQFGPPEDKDSIFIPSSCMFCRYGPISVRNPGCKVGTILPTRKGCCKRYVRWHT